VDVGSSKTSVVPIHDGYVLRKGVQVQSVGGDFISDETLKHFDKAKIQIVPQYLVSSKTAVDSGQAPIYEEFPFRRSKTTESYHEMQVKNTLDDFKETICAVSELPFNPNLLVKKAVKNYELPNGYNNAFRMERFRFAEGLFDPRYIIRGPDEDPATATSHAPIMHMIRAALNNVDIDLRSLLLSNIVLMGGATLMHGFGERIYNELYNGIPGVSYVAAYNRRKSRFMLLPRLWRGNLGLGLVVLYLHLWVLSINCGYQNSSTRKWEQQLRRNFINSIEKLNINRLS
jgi:actin-related protein